MLILCSQYGMHLLHHGVSKYRADSTLGPACWPHFDLLVILGGSFHFDLPQGMEAVAGDALLVPKGVRFRGRTSSFGGTLWVHHFRPGRTEKENWLHRLPSQRMRHYPGGVRGDWSQALLARIHEIHSHPTLRPEQILLFRLLLDRVRRSSSDPRPSVIQQAIEAAKDCQWQGIDSGWMARSAGLSQSHFRARFLAETGKTIGDFLKTRRLERAQEVLRTTDVPIKEISREAGYSELSAFYHAFRKAAGCSPAKFRKRHPPMV